MFLPDNLLNPIPGPNPSGESLRYASVSKRDATFFYDKVKEARRESEDIGEYSQEGKKADFDLVIKLCTDALAERTKDLQIAAWLAESLLQTQRFAGFKEGLDLLKGLVENFWDTLYPELEDGDSELRTAPLEWIGQLGSAVQLLPITEKKSGLTDTGFNWFEQKQASKTPTEEESGSSDAKRKARDTAVKEGKVLPEQFEEAFTATQKTFYKQLASDLAALEESLAALDEICTAKFGAAGPSFGNLRTALEESRVTARTLLKKKLELDPDPVEPSPVAPADGAAQEGVGSGAGGAARTQTATARWPVESISAQPGDREQAIACLIAAAQFLRQQEPSNPISYLVLRGLRWGELRASGTELNPMICEGPPGELRQQMKRAALEGNWAEVLATAETAVALPCGRAWLDPHRYVVKACTEQGYLAVAAAVKSELRALLADYPGLIEAVLLDDTGAANPETQAWLRAEVLSGG
ncbi:MAG TPA: type VI secretion system protein TssA [Terriglobia bacterium]|nr:type VI secretion system protein TssA [Terriglobia bacterium]